VSELIASYTAEQTARFFGGGEIGKPKYADPELQARVDRLQQRLLKAFDDVVEKLSEAVVIDGQITNQRLNELWYAARRGDARSRDLLGVLINELLKQATLQ